MNKKFKKITIVFIGLLLLNLLGKQIYKRFDLTQDQRYTLSKTTLKITKKINTKLIVTVYLEGNFPAEFQKLQIETKQFLEELQALNNHIYFRFINPKNKEDILIKKGMYPSQLTVEEDGQLSNSIIFPWAEISYKNTSKIISLLPNLQVKTQEEQLQNAVENLEYAFAEAINAVTQKQKKKIAVLSGNGELKDVYLYSFLNSINKKYHLAKFTLDSVKKTPQKTLKALTKFDLAIIAKPTEKFTEKQKFTLDQFIINGGKALWMLDNVQADTDSLFNNGKMLAYPRDLNLTDLFFAYGIRINNKLIKDVYAAKLKLASGNLGGQTQFKDYTWQYHPLVNGNPNHLISKKIIPVRLQFATQIDTLKSKIKKTPLLVSSPFTKQIGLPNFIELSSISTPSKKEEFTNGNQLFSVLLEGNFTSAYANRTLPFDNKFIRKTTTENKMIVIADGDIGKNQILKGNPYDLALDKWTQQRFGNKDFLLNAVDYLLDDTGLIQLKNKTLQIAILNKQKALNQRVFWQLFNLILPLFLLIIFGVIFNYYKKKQYTS